jgi:hypothetical protein
MALDLIILLGIAAMFIAIGPIEAANADEFVRRYDGDREAQRAVGRLRTRMFRTIMLLIALGTFVDLARRLI